MTDLGGQLAAYLKTAESICTAERRAFRSKRGVPDALIWLHPKDITVSRCIPLLFELETFGNYYSGRDDPEKFARRYEDDKHQYNLRWPVIGDVPLSKIEVGIEYELRVVPSAEVTGQFETSEGDFFSAIKDWSDIAKRSIRPTVKQHTYSDTKVIIWSSELRAFGGYKFEINLPFFIEIGDNIEELVRTRLDTISLPVIIVVDGRPPNYEETLVRDTVVEFKSISPSTVRRLGKKTNHGIT